MSKQITDTAKKFGRFRALVGAILLSAVLSMVSVLSGPRPVAEAAVSNTINFQARLMQSNGALVPDGYYNVQFKLYNVSSAGSALWTETYYDSNGATAGNDNRLRVSNGYLTVSLNSLNDNWGSITSWDQELWLTMNIGGATQTATPTWDGEMNPRLKLTAVPYAFQAKNAEGLNKTTGVNTSTLSWANQTAANAILLPDAAGTVCLQGNAACGFMTGSAGDYIQNGTALQTANFNITGTGSVGNLRTQDVDANGVPLSLGTTDATAVNISKYGLMTHVQGGLSVAETATIERGIEIGSTLDPLAFTTPLGANVTSRLVIPVHNPGAFNQIIALGLSSTAATSSRVISLFDARGAGDNQPPLSVFSPDESSVFGLGWDGQNNEGYLKTIGTKGIGIKVNNHVAMSIGGTNGNATFRNQNNTTSGFAVQSAAGTSLLNIDTLNSGIILGASTVITAGNSLTLTGGITGSRPASPTEGTVFFDTTTKQLLTYSNGKWQADSKAATFVVAAIDSSQAAKDAAHYVVSSAEDSSGAGAGTIDGAQIKINQALDAAEALGGGIVYLQEGTYTIDATIAIPNKVSLVGAGPATVIRLGNFGATTTNIDAITNKDVVTGDRVAIRDILLDGRKSINTAGTQRGFYVNNVGGGSGASMREGVSISGVIAKDFYTNNARITASKYGRVTNSSFVSAGSTGMYIDSTSSNMSIMSSTFDSNGQYGLFLSGSSNNSVSGNVVTSNTDRGIILVASSNANTISGNIVKSNGNIGIHIQASSQNIISGNVSGDNTSHGLVLTSTSLSNSVTGNTVSGNLGLYGIRIEATSDYNQVSNNILRDNGGTADNNAITINNSDYNAVINNNITDSSVTSTNRAIWISTSTADANQLSGNLLGGGVITDVGTGTLFMGQLDQNGYVMNKGMSGGFAIADASGAALMTASLSADAVGIFGALEVQTDAANALLVQTAGDVDVFRVNTNTNQVVVGTSGTSPTLFVLGSKTTDGDPASGTNGAMYYNSFMNQFRCYINGAWTGCGGSGGGGGGVSRMVVLVPEFAGGTLQADGTNNAGVMNADFVSGLSAGQGYKHNYYQWTSSNASTQDYNIVVNTPVPTDYVSGFTNFKIWGYSSSTSLATATIQLYDVDGTACYASPVSFTPSTASTWEQKAIGSPSGCTFAGNDIITMIITVNARSNEVFRVGEISFGYTN